MASANVSFETIPSSIRKPGKYFEFNTKLAVRTLPANAQRVLIVGQRLAAGSIAALTPTLMFSDAEAAAGFGAGSQAHRMVRAVIKANAYADITVCAVDDKEAGVAASGSYVFATATASGSAICQVGGDTVEAPVTKGDTGSAIAAALKTAFDKLPDLTVTAASADATLTLTAKHKGAYGNGISLGFAATNGCTTATVTAMASGSGDAEITPALAAVFGEQYHVIACASTENTNLTALRTHLEAVSGAIEQRPGIGVYGQTGALAATTTAAGDLNTGRVVSAYLRGSRSHAMEIGAAMAGVLAFEEDPARPLNTLELKGILAPAVADRLSRNEQENLLANGVTPLEVGPGNRVQVVRAISTYTQDAQGVDDVSLLDITTIRTLDYVRKACRERVALRFPREKLSSKTPPKVRSELLDVLFKLEELEIVENVAEHADKLIVERDLQDNNRLDAAIPADVVNGMHVLAGRIDLLL